MSEIDQLKARIDKSGYDSIPTARIRDDYAPVGDLMIHDLCTLYRYVQRKVKAGRLDMEWRIFNADTKPY